jgi:hypothetical protein
MEQEYVVEVVMQSMEWEGSRKRNHDCEWKRRWGELLCGELVVWLEDVKVTGDRLGRLGQDLEVRTVSGMQINGHWDIRNLRGTKVHADFLWNGGIWDWADGSVCWI